MMAKKKATVMVCDNPDCGNTRLTSREDPALGYYLGKGVMHESWGGGPIGETYACSYQCVAPAIAHILEVARTS